MYFQEVTLMQQLNISRKNQEKKQLHTLVNQLIEQAIQGAKLEPYPVGSIYISINKTNPEELFGGTWETWGSGRVPVGVDDNQTEFNTVEKNGGEKNVALTVNQMPKHSHTFSGTTSTASLVGRFMAEAWNTHWADGIVKLTVPNPNLSGTSGNGFGQGNYTIDASHSHTVTGTIGEAGGGGAHNNLQPYITCYMWKRTA